MDLQVQIMDELPEMTKSKRKSLNRLTKVGNILRIPLL
jgi:hypothetical protein